MPRGVSVPGALAALLAVTADSYILLVLGPGVGHRLGRIFIFVSSFVAILAIACAAGALTRRRRQRAALLGMAAVGLGTLGALWLWIRLFTFETAALLLIAAAFAVVATASAIKTKGRPIPTAVSAVAGACIGLVILGAGLIVSIAPTCGAAGSSFHIDSWHQPWSAAYACGDGRLAFELWP
jgi:O-antigen/teichoic acid export membrane protein